MSTFSRLLILFMMATCCLSEAIATDGDFIFNREEAIFYLKARKKGFEEYQRAKQKRALLRESESQEQKKIRSADAKAREIARQQYRRDTQFFPAEAYNKFLVRRSERKNREQKARRNFSKTQQDLREIYRKKEYNIDGMKEYELR